MERIMKVTSCSREGCNKQASQIPVILAWAKGYPKKYHPPIEMKMDLPHCEDCAAKTHVNDLLTDEGWKMIENAVAVAKRLPPDRKTVGLKWSGIGYSPFGAKS
jgi:hypothetical protein